MKIQPNQINHILETIVDAKFDAERNNVAYSVVYIDSLQEVITVKAEFSGEDFGWKHILSVFP
tara:strand:+ start:1998 stop:2186 length:189 start_codon:yes stop_codon:yes gene_type:complete